MNNENTNRRRFLGAASAGLLASYSPLTNHASVADESSVPDSKLPADVPVELQPSGADLGRLFSDVDRLARLHEFEYSFLGDRFASLQEFKTESRERLLQLLLYRPQPIAPNPEVLERVDLGTVIREKILFSTTPEFRVPAYVHIPKGLRRPAPAIIDLHSHGGMFIFGKEKVTDLGHNHPTMDQYHKNNYDGRATGTALAQRGYVVISIDAFMFGERRTILDEDLKYGFDRSHYSVADVRHLNGKCRSKEDTLVKSLIYAGMTWPGIVFWDDIRTVDYLLTRPEVDPSRIGCNGISLGGYRSLFLAGLDERIAAANVVGFMSTVKSMIQARIDTHSWVHFTPTLHRYLDLPDVVSMMAPKPLMVQQCARDGLFTLPGMKAASQKITDVYRKAQCESQFTSRFYDTPHRFTLSMQDEAFAFFDKHLKT